MSINYTADQLQRKFQDSAGFARLAEVLRREDKVDEAIALCQEGLRKRPNQLSGYLVLGKCLMDADRMEAAKEQFEAALRVDPRCLSALHSLARIMEKLQWQDAAVSFYRSILAVEPWDREIQAMTGTRQPEARQPFAQYQPAPDPGSGFAGSPDHQQTPDAASFLPTADREEAIEFNLNQMDDFLSKEDPDSLSEGLEETPLDPVSGLDVENRLDSIFGTAVPGRRDEPSASAAAPASADFAAPADASEDGSPPISGQDVEDRLDSLFGFTDEPAPSKPAETVTAVSDAAAVTQSAPVTGQDVENRLDSLFGGTEAPFASEPDTQVEDLAETPPISGQDVEDRLDSLFGFDAAPTAVPTGDSVRSSYIPQPEPAASDAAADAEASEQLTVTGQDVEDRLDSLFNLGETTGLSQASVSDAAATSYALDGMQTEPADTTFAPFEQKLADEEDRVQGKDVENRLDDLFSLSPEPETARAASDAAEDPSPADESLEQVLRLDPEPGTQTMRIQETISGQDVEDRLDSLFGEDPPGRPGPKPEQEFVPEITGSDIEAQLDKLFSLGDEPKAGRSATETAGFTAVSGDSVTYEERNDDGSQFSGDVPGSGSDRNMPGDERDRTLIMPAMKESVSDWLAGRSETPVNNPDASPPRLGGEEGRDTLIFNRDEIAGLPEGEEALGPAAPWHEAEPDPLADARETGVFRFTMDEAPSGATELGDDGALPADMVDGTDVGERLDQMFGVDKAPRVPESPGAPGEVPLDLELFAPDGPAETASETGKTGEDSVVSGEGLSMRLEEIFNEAPGESPMPEILADADRPGGVAPTEDFEPVLLSEEPTHGLSTPQATPVSPPASPSGKELAPLNDEDEAYPEEDEASQEGTGANVATVTLAEIYFQQGLKEQALQIYRQLLEREPGNESVRKRIHEIEATQSENDSRGHDADHRRPRPGMKVPKRKK